MDLRVKIPIAGTLVSLVVLGGSLATLYYTVATARAGASARHIIDVIDATEATWAQLERAEAAARSDDALEPTQLRSAHLLARPRLEAALTRLRELTRADASLARKVDQLAELVRERAGPTAPDVAGSGRERALQALVGSGAPALRATAIHPAQPLLDELVRTQRHALAEALAAHRRAARRLAAAVLIFVTTTLALAIGCAAALRREITAPTQRLLTGLGRVAGGDWTVQLPPGRADELGRLTAAFNDMVRKSREAVEAHGRAEAQRHESEERFRLAFTEAPIGMALVDLEGRFVRVNRALSEIVGYPQEELLTVMPEQLLHPADREASNELALRLARGEIPRYQTDQRYLRKSATIVDVRVSVSIVRNGRGQPLYFIAQLEDVTTRKRAQREREDSLHRLRAVLAHTPVAIALTEEDRGWQANACAQELFALSSEAFASSHWLGSILDAEGQPVPLERLPSSRALSGEQSHDVEMRVRRPDGRLIPVLVNAAAIYTNNHGQRSAVVAFEDISALKELERMRAEWNAMIAHDLRQPLSGISLQVQLIKETAQLDPSLQPRIERIQQATRRLSRMIQDLLDLSRIEARHFDLERRPVDLADTIRASASTMAFDAPDRHFDVRVPASLDPVLADPDRIAQVMDNLLSNAIKYGAPGTPIRVEVRRLDDRIAVAVTNEGPGIPLEKLNLLFQRFQRVVGPGVVQRQSVGLGLFITRSLVQAHGGTIEVESTPGGQTTFRFVLPLAPPARQRVGEHAPA